MEDSKTMSCEIKIKRSLVISPNLDALLEHEERTRVQTPPVVLEMTTSALSSRSVSPNEEFPVGLPPPPRHPQRVKSLRSISSLKGKLLLSEDTELQVRETPEKIVKPTSSSASNPYINPAPTLADLLVGIPSVTINSLQPHDLPTLSNSRDRLPVGDYLGQHSSPSTSHVSKLRRVKLSTYSNCNVEAPMRNPEDPQRFMAVSSKNKAKTEDIKHADSQTSGVSDSEIPWRRPLISHTRRPSSDSTNTFSISSHEPATTVEDKPRISISSTIYPPSASISHSHSLYNDSVLSLTKDKQNRDSHMEIYSLSNAESNLDSTSNACPQLSPIQFSKLSLSEYSLSSSSPDSSTPHSSKPPLPTTPKPVFSRTSTRQPFLILTDRPKTSGAPLPPTTNFLDMEERADLVRKTRKLARVFGQIPRTDVMVRQEKSVQDASLSPTSRHSSVLNDLGCRRPRPALELEPVLLNGPRRHSVPLTSDDMPFTTKASSPSFKGHRYDQVSHAEVQSRPELSSFINLSTDSLDGDDIAFIMPEADKITKSLPNSPTQSQFEKMFEEQADEERRRKRERLAKLHRFLGSRVPVGLVLGIGNIEASLPPPHRSPINTSPGSADFRKIWLKRRRSSSADPPCSHWPNGLERVKEELNDKEKFINVRRAIKMEKVFGVAPPQTLYHTRCSPPPPLLASKSSPSEVRTNSSPTASAPYLQPNSNRSPYLKHKSKKTNRPGTADSNTPLLSNDQQTLDDPSGSSIYNHYQYSLNSLHDILDRDDRGSLIELHQYLHAGENPAPQLEVSPVAIGRRMSTGSSIISGRRRSLPAMASMVSLDSEYSLTMPENTFQVRRRRAAKLTQFFGVDYRELISDVLQSIENGVEHEHEIGTLRAEEVEDLFNKLRSLKAKRQSFL